MKQAMKRFGAMLLTMAMLLSLAVTGVSAEEEPAQSTTTPSVKITFSGWNGSDELKAYRVIEYTTDYNGFKEAGTVANGKTSFWNFLKSKANNADPAKYLATVTSDNQALRTLLKEFMGGVDNTNALPDAAYTVSDGVLDTVTPGYYILQVKSNTKIYNTMLLFVGYENGNLVAKMDGAEMTATAAENNEYTAKIKMQDGPTVAKFVFDDRDVTAEGRADALKDTAKWKSAAASEVGKVVDFAIKVELPTYHDDAAVELTLKDTLKNLEYVTGSAAVYYNNSVNYEKIEDAILNTSNYGAYNDGSQELNIALSYEKLKETSSAVKEFYVYYQAILKDGAVVDNQHQGTNNVTLNYIVKTSAGEYSGTPKADEVTVYTYNFKLDKKYNGEDKIPSTAAQFSVYAGLNENGSDVDTNNVLTFKLADGGYYYPSNEEGALESIPANFEIRGLDVNTPYYVKEVETPAGYYAPSSYFTLQLSGDEKAATTVLNGALKHEGEGEKDYKKPSSFVAAKTVDQALVMNDHTGENGGNGQNYGNINTNTNKKHEYDVTLNNSTTPVLPSTGGMGTTLFTVGGVALLALAAAMLILRRRKN